MVTQSSQQSSILVRYPTNPITGHLCVYLQNLSNLLLIISSLLSISRKLCCSHRRRILPIGIQVPWILSAYPAKYLRVFMVPWRSTNRVGKKGFPLFSDSIVWRETGETFWEICDITLWSSHNSILFQSLHSPRGEMWHQDNTKPQIQPLSYIYMLSLRQSKFIHIS